MGIVKIRVAMGVKSNFMLEYQILAPKQLIRKVTLCVRLEVSQTRLTEDIEERSVYTVYCNTPYDYGLYRFF